MPAVTCAHTEVQVSHAISFPDVVGILNRPVGFLSDSSVFIDFAEAGFEVFFPLDMMMDYSLLPFLSGSFSDNMHVIQGKD